MQNKLTDPYSSATKFSLSQHVCADTLRSTAVLIAAGIATVFQSIDGGKADAIAAVVVSVIILVSIIPLMQGLVLTGFEIRYLTRNPPRE
mmetsp:Transcript_28361/g.59267  ORF Transcript_28361/g.59267 Transcript_28361/m.59267 type:complete len:90 (+) Transcript_28361:61-330(+)